MSCKMLPSCCDTHWRIFGVILVLFDWLVDGVKYTEENILQSPDAIEIGDWKGHISGILSMI